MNAATAAPPIAYPLREAAAAVGVSPQHIRREIAAGRLPAKKVGRGYSVGAIELRAWFERQGDA